MSNDRFEGLERFAPLFEAPEPSYEAFLRRRDRKHRNQRIVAGVVGIALFVATVPLVAGLSSLFSRTPTPVDKPPPTVVAESPTGSATISHLRADARVTFDGTTCHLDGVTVNANSLSVAVHANTLRLELVNTSGDTALIRIGRVVGSGAWPGADADRHMEEVRLSTLGSSESRLAVREDAEGTWGVICYGNKYVPPISYNSFAPKQVDTAGPLEVVRPNAESESAESEPLPPDPRADARVTFDGSTCTLDGVDGPVYANTLRLELVNISGEGAQLRIGRITGNRIWPTADTNRYFEDVTSEALYSKPKLVALKHAAGRWGFVCYGNRYDSPNENLEPPAFAPEEVDTAGPLEVVPPYAQPESAEPSAPSHEGADATITLDESRCTLHVANDPINADAPLKLEFVNDSGDPVLFRIGRITIDRAWPRANPNRFFREVWASGGSLPDGLGSMGEVVDPSESQVWSSNERNPVGRWGVICYGNKFRESSPAYETKQIGAVGPLVVE